MHAHLLFALIAVVFVCVKIPYMQLPYYWDEAWVYAPAIQEMAAAGPSLAPDAIPAELTRGHPLLFHFTGAVWASIFGKSLLSLHTFALVISLLLLFTVYRVLGKWFGAGSGLLAVVVLCVQPLFFAQSVLVLPEVMLSLFLLLALENYISQKWVWYWLAASAAVLTKETGVALFAALSLHRLVLLIYQKEEVKRHLLILAKINFPFLVFAGFLMWQKAVRGWMFFPYHLDLMHIDFDFMIYQLGKYLRFVFIYQGRNILLFTLIGMWVWIFIRRTSLNRFQWAWFIVAGIFTLVYFMLSSVNFYSGRYVLIIAVLLTMAAAACVSVAGIKKWMLFACFIVLPAPSLINLITYPGKEDNERGYADAVEVMQHASRWLVKAEHRDKTLYTSFLIENILTDARQGYIAPGEERKYITSNRAEARYIALSSFESGDDMNLLIADTTQFTIVQKFEKNHALLIIAENKALAASTQNPSPENR
jgi:4-amino-4-deoxy-L-arabinose transferase-like glycosyltransferase